MKVKSRGSRPRVTFKEIAKELGVAVSTVSNAYNRPDQLSPALREKVLETARKLGYSGPDPMARSLRRRRAGAIGVVYGDELSYAFTDPVHALMLQGVATAIRNEHLGLLLISGWSEKPEETCAVRDAAVDGFLIHTLNNSDPLLAAILERTLPSVYVDRPGTDGLPSVVVEDEGGAKEAARHLLELGHRNLGVLALPLSLGVRDGIISPEEQAESEYWAVRQRLKGYRSAAQEFGIAWEKNVTVYQSVENRPQDGQVAAGVLLSQTPRPTAILAMSDQLALGVLEYATEHGIRVPEELSVVGFDDAPLAARLRPGLTTVHQDHLEKGKLAGQTLLALIKGEEYPSSVTLPTHLVVRATTAPPPEIV